MKLSFRQSFQLLKRYLKPEWLRVALLFLLLVSGIGLQLLQPQILRDFIDLATGSISQTAVFNLQSLSGTAVLFMLVALFNQLLTGAATYVTQDVRWRVTNELRAGLAQHCLSLDMSFHNARTAGEMISRVDEDIKA